MSGAPEGCGVHAQCTHSPETCRSGHGLLTPSQAEAGPREDVVARLVELYCWDRPLGDALLACAALAFEAEPTEAEYALARERATERTRAWLEGVERQARGSEQP